MRSFVLSWMLYGFSANQNDIIKLVREMVLLCSCKCKKRICWYCFVSFSVNE